MRKATKILFSLMSLLALAYVGLTAYGLYGLVWFRTWPYPMWPQGEITGMVGFWGTAFLGAVTGLLALGLLIRSLFVRTRHRSLLLGGGKDDDMQGSIRITESSIMSCVQSSLASFRDILDVEVKPSLIKKGETKSLRLRIHAGIPDHGPMAYLVPAIQDTVRKDVEAYTGLPVETIDVLLDAVATDHPVDQEDHHQDQGIVPGPPGAKPEDLISPDAPQEEGHPDPALDPASPAQEDPGPKPTSPPQGGDV